MRFARKLDVVGVHAEGEVGDVIVSGVLDPPGKTMYDKMIHLWEHNDGVRQLLLNEPRGRSSMCTNLIVSPCNPKADVGLIIMEADEYAPMSGSNTICTVTALLETGTIPMKEPLTELALDTAAGLITVKAECLDGKCKSVEFHNAPSFVFGLDQEIVVPELGTIKVDLAYGGMIFAIVDVAAVGQSLAHHRENGADLVLLGEKIKAAVRKQTNPVHPENSSIQGVSILVFADPLMVTHSGKSSKNGAVVMPGRFDRSPCGTATCARMAVLHARGLLDVGETFLNRSMIDTEFEGRVVSTTTVGDYPAIVPSIKGRAWITSFKQVVLDPSDPFPEGFRVGDSWHPSVPGPSIKDKSLEAYYAQKR